MEALKAQVSGIESSLSNIANLLFTQNTLKNRNKLSSARLDFWVLCVSGFIWLFVVFSMLIKTPTFTLVIIAQNMAFNAASCLWLLLVACFHSLGSSVWCGLPLTESTTVYGSLADDQFCRTCGTFSLCFQVQLVRNVVSLKISKTLTFRHVLILEIYLFKTYLFKQHNTSISYGRKNISKLWALKILEKTDIYTSHQGSRQRREGGRVVNLVHLLWPVASAFCLTVGVVREKMCTEAQ